MCIRDRTRRDRPPLPTDDDRIVDDIRGSRRRLDGVVLDDEGAGERGAAHARNERARQQHGAEEGEHDRDGHPLSVGTGRMDAMDSWRAVLLPTASEPAQHLALGVELRVRESAAAAHWGARRVRAATARDLSGQDAGAELLVGLRPLARRQEAGAWTRAGVSWDLLRRGARTHSRPHRQSYAELYRTQFADT